MKLCNACGARYRGDPSKCPLDGSALVHLPDPLIGRTIGGRYVIREKIGSGGMGTVYRALHEVLERDVAVKFLAPELAFDEQSRARFLREAKAANRINHEHIIDITDFGETDDGLVYLVMEFLDGIPLDRLLLRGALPQQRALRIALQMAWALGRAHEFEVVHRDIKPENIYLLQSHGGDFIKILDFGLAHVKGELRLTASGTVFGTPEYMAPEQARGMKATAATDLYALGCVLFEMLTGRLPFQGATSALILKHIREAPPVPSVLDPTLPAEVDRLVLDLLHKDPQQRPRSAYRVAERIGGLLAQQTGLSTPPEPVSLAEERPPRVSRTRMTGSTVSSEDMWVERVAVMRQALMRAHPDGPAAPLEDVMRQLEGHATEIRRLKRERDERLEDVSRREEELRETRLRIGRALDELARDEELAACRIAESEAPAHEARRALDELERELLERWQGLPDPPKDGRELGSEALADLEAIGATARRCADARANLRALEATLEPWRRQCEDLRFQITQLKGRLASIGAEEGYELDSAKAEADALDRHVRAEIEEVVRVAQPVMQHLLGFPELRDLVLAARGVQQNVG